MTREERKRWRRCVASVVAGTLVLWAAALLLCVTANASGHGAELTAGQAAGAPLQAYIAGASVSGGNHQIKQIGGRKHEVLSQSGKSRVVRTV